MPAEGTGLPSVGDEIAGKYRLESVLGQGGMGTVYAARNAMTGKRVAIKYLLPEHASSTVRERLLREARIAASIDHPNVVDIYDVAEHQGSVFLVMEYLRGKPLSDLLAERGRLDPDELIALLVPAMRGVHAAHLAGVIHRDLKAENIILSETDGQIVPKVVDFGVSKMVGASEVPNASLTRTGALVGTPHYMALEQIDGSNAVDSRTDVYAFGVLLYRALTGYFPFDGSSLGEVILKIGTRDPTPMRILRPELPLGLDNQVLRALARDRRERQRDLEDLARSLAPFALPVRRGEEATPSSLHPSIPPAAMSFRTVGASCQGDHSRLSDPSLLQITPVPPSPSRARRAFGAGAAVALIALIALAIVWSRRGDAHLPASASSPFAPPPIGAVGASMSLSPAPEHALGASLPSGKVESDDERPANVASSRGPVSAPNAEKARNVKSVHAPVPSAPVRKVVLPSRIPGDRTNGLAADEF